MLSIASRIVLSGLVSAASVAAHGHIIDAVVNGVSFLGFDPTSFPYMHDPPTVAGWTTAQLDNGFVAPNRFAAGDIICHKNASNAGGHIPIQAGDSVLLQWTAWPDSHKGPVIVYLAKCDGDCKTVDKHTLEFFKIDAAGLVDGSTESGTWGSDQLIANNNSWTVKIPLSIAPGNYVLRSEIIALHNASHINGAQNYPQCLNLQVTGSGTETPAGIKGPELYTETDPGILVDIYTALSTYKIPGPTLVTDATNAIQTSSVVTATGTGTATAEFAVSSALRATAVANPKITTINAGAIVSSVAVSFESSASIVATSSSPAAIVVAPSAPTDGPGCPAAAKVRQHPRDVRMN